MCVWGAVGSGEGGRGLLAFRGADMLERKRRG